MADYKIVLLKGDGIGPEIVNQAVKVLDKASEKFNFTVEYDEALLGVALLTQQEFRSLMKQLLNVRQQTVCF